MTPRCRQRTETAPARQIVVSCRILRKYPSFCALAHASSHAQMSLYALIKQPALPMSAPPNSARYCVVNSHERDGLLSGH